MSNKTFVVGLIILLFLLVSYEYTIAGGPWKGKIIDIETKEPIEGAVVLAVWERVYRTPAGASSYFYEAKEVLTDKEGRFEIPSYTPINLVPLISYMRGPLFTIFKPGYGSLQMAVGQYLTGEVPRDFLTGQIKAVWDFELSEKKYRLTPGLIELPSLKTREERRMAKPTPVGDKKDWKKQKEFIRLIREEWKYLTGKPAGDLYQIEED